MLYSFKRYQSRAMYSSQIDINHKILNKLILSKNVFNVIYSTFFRKMFFRTLLLYLNNIYCNFFFYSDTNFFYFTAFIHSKYSNYHPSFYHRHMCII